MWTVTRRRLPIGKVWLVIDKGLGVTYMDKQGDQPQRFHNSKDARNTAAYLNFQRELGNDLGILNKSPT